MRYIMRTNLAADSLGQFTKQNLKKMAPGQICFKKRMEKKGKNNINLPVKQYDEKKITFRPKAKHHFTTQHHFIHNP